MEFKLRQYQTEAFDKILQIYKDNPKDMRAVYQAPTGSGKTLTSLLIGITHCKSQGYKHLLWVAHQKYLSEQPMDRAFKALGIQMTDNPNIGFIDGIYIHCITWQSARNKIDTTKYDMLIVDEVHQGGSNNNTDHKTFRKLLQDKHFKSQLYVSATPWKLDKRLFKGLLNKDGEFKSSRTAITDLQTLKDLGYICDIVFKSIQTEDTIKLKKLADKEVEEFTGDPESLSDDIINKQVDMKDPANVKILRQSVANSILTAYISEEASSIETLPPTLVFASSVDTESDPTSAENLRKNIKQRFYKQFGSKVPQGFVQVVHSRLEDNTLDAQTLLQEFKEGKFKVLIVCGMAKEGYDYPELQVVLDFKPSYRNERQFMQKTGRLLRISEGKTLGRYYIADTLSLYIDQQGVKKDINAETIDNFKKTALTAGVSIDDDTADQVKDVLNLIGGLKAKENPKINPIINGAFDVKNIEEIQDEEAANDSSNLNFPKEPVKKTVTIVTAAYIVANAYASKINMKNFMLFDGILTKAGSPDPEGNKKILIEEWFKKGKKPNQYSKDPKEKRLSDLMRHYLSKSSFAFCKKFKIIHDQYFPNTVEQNKKILINKWFKKGKKPSQCSKDPGEKKLGGVMWSYVARYPEFKAIYDQYFPYVDTVKENKEILIEKWFKNGKRPNKRSEDTEEKKLGEALGSYIQRDKQFRAIYYKYLPKEVK